MRKRKVNPSIFQPKVNHALIDWSKQDCVLAREHNCTRQRIFQLRAKYRQLDPLTKGDRTVPSPQLAKAMKWIDENRKAIRGLSVSKVARMGGFSWYIAKTAMTKLKKST
jgi:hypothetical protein